MKNPLRRKPKIVKMRLGDELHIKVSDGERSWSVVALHTITSDVNHGVIAEFRSLDHQMRNRIPVSGNRDADKRPLGWK